MPDSPQRSVQSLGRRQSLLRWPKASLRAYFMAVIVVATVPVAGLTGYLVFEETRVGSHALEEGLRRTAATFALTVEREIVSSIDALYILSYSDSLQRDDVAGFFATLTALPKMRSTWSSAYLVSLDGDVQFNTRQPFGKPLLKVGDAAALERLKRTGEPVLTDLIESPDGQATTSIMVPVVIKGQVRYALGAWISPDNWQKLMTSVSVAPGGFVSVYDSRHHVIARSAEHQRFMGKPIPQAMRQAMGQLASGITVTPSLTGEQSYVAWQRIPSANWGIGVGTPAEPIARAHAVAIASTLVTGLLSLIAGLALAMLVARRVTKPLQLLAQEGPEAVLEPSEVIELAWLQQALRLSQTQREQARERLQAKADEFETLFQNSPIGLAIAQDKDCRGVLRNPALAAMFNEQGDGRLPPHTVRQNGAVLHPDDQPLKRAALTGAKMSDVELEVVHEDGRAVQLIAHAVPLYDLAGQPRGAIGAYTDITERKHAEESLILAERRLRESQHMVDLAQEAGHVGFFDFQCESNVVTWTSGLARLFNIGLADSKGTWDTVIHHIEPQDRQNVKDALRRATEQHLEQALLEFRARRADGSVRWLSGRVVVQYGTSHQPVHMIGVVVDVTQQKEVEQERAAFMAREQAARVEAENANRAKDEFLAMLGHELRNPLGAIAAASEVLNRVSSDNPAAASARAIIARQTRHLARLMDDLLDVARVITGKIMLTRHPIDLAQAVQRLVTTLEVAGKLSEHQLHLQLAEAWVNADATRIEQVIYNLVTNALKYTPNGGSITLTVRMQGSVAVLEVADSGVGMSPALLSRVFDLFVQGDRSLDRRQGGLGIGLTLVRRLTELHGGSVSAASAGHQQGSIFTVRLPLIAASEPSAQEPAPALQPGHRVVVIEDNEDVRDALRTLLQLAGHTVSTANDGEAGLKLIVDTTPDVALIDIGLPRLNGYEVAQQVRQAGVPVRLIALSGYGQPKDVEAALAAGFDAHLVKPVDPQALQALVNQT